MNTPTRPKSLQVTNWILIATRPSGFGADDLGDTLADDDETTLTIAPQEANLSLDKSVDDTTPNVGDVVTFTVQVDNAGPDTASNVSIADQVPDGYSIIGGSVSNGGIFNLGGSEVLWNLTNVPLAGLTLTYQASVNAPTGTLGEYDNTVQITAADQYDSNSTPNNDDGDQSEDDEDIQTVVPEGFRFEFGKRHQYSFQCNT